MSPNPGKPAADKLRVAIVGGSLGGLTTALLLRTLGHDLDVFERATGEMTGLGAGIIAHEVSVRYFVERTTTSLDTITVPIRTYRLLDGAGSLLWQEAVNYRSVSWGSLYRGLLTEFGRDRYHQGAALAGFSQDEEGVDLRFANGQQLRYDLLILADGVLTTGRQRLFPAIEPLYAGYVAWRGTVAERDLPPHLLEQLDGTVTFALIPNSHIVVYPIPGADSRVDRGHRLWNFVWYRNIDKGPTFDELMTDCDGFPHSISLRPARVQARYVRQIKELAAALLPNQLAAIVTAVEHPFLQAVMDIESPTMAVGRVCLLGDAAFALRPHPAAGTAKAAEDAWTLAAALESFDGDLPATLQSWSSRQTALGKSLIARARQMGDGSQFHCNWQPGDPSLRYGLYEPGDSSIWHRPPRPALL